MKMAAVTRLKQEDGASLSLALLFFVICGVAASMILAAASATAGKMEQIPAADQKRFTVESAAAFLRDELKYTGNTIKIKEVQVINEKNSSENSDTVTYYFLGKDGTLSEENTWKKIDSSDASLLATYVKNYYVPLGLDEDSEEKTEDTDDQEGYDASADSGTSGDSEKNDGSADSENEIVNEDVGSESKDKSRVFMISVKVEDAQEGEGQTAQSLQAKVEFTMDSDYGITAVISDTVTDVEKHLEDLCKRVLTVPAKVETETDVDIQHETEKDGEGIVTDEWNVITTTRWTTIQWQKGTIKTVKTETSES